MHNDANGDSGEDLAQTPLHDLHTSIGARMVGFAGYEMPVQYASGILKEHLHTRAHAGLFDVSHMGQLAISESGGDLHHIAQALEKLVPADVAGLLPWRQRYTYFTNQTGGILDDLMIAHLGDCLLLIVNAATKEADEAHLRSNLPGSVKLERLDRALLALQGPEAQVALERLIPECAATRFMDVRRFEIAGAECIVSRSGYTGEDGFEISVPNEHAAALAQTLLEMAEVEPIGLGARDSLRLEAGLCLYGSDIDTTTTPVEADLGWAIPEVRRSGERAGGFPGDRIILEQLCEGAPRKRVGLLPAGRAPVRGGAELYDVETAGNPIGVVTSGGFGPSVGGPVAMGYVRSDLAAPGTRLFAEVRGKRLAIDVSQLPFIAPGYKRS